MSTWQGKILVSSGCPYPRKRPLQANPISSKSSRILTPRGTYEHLAAAHFGSGEWEAAAVRLSKVVPKFDWVPLVRPIA